MQDHMTTSPWPVCAEVDWGGENHQLCVAAPDGKRLLEVPVQVSSLAAITRGAAAFAGLRGVHEELDRELASAVVGLWISSP